MKRLLVPTDFSNAARNAAVYATELAKVSHSKIILFHSYFVPSMAGNEVVVTMTDEKEMHEGKLEKLKDEAYIIGGDSELEISCVANEGSPARSILEMEEESDPELVIVGMKEPRELGSFIFGSVATDLIKETKKPLLIVPEGYSFKRIDKIVFASDLIMDTDMKMHKVLKWFHHLFHSKIAVLTIIKKDLGIKNDNSSSERRMIKYFENIDHNYYFLKNENLVEGLKEFISNHNSDVLVMIPHERDLWEKLFRTRDTKKMAFNTTIPLLILPPK